MKLIDSGTVFDASQQPPKSRSCAFTSVARLGDGTLLVAFRNATGRDEPDGRLRVMRSRDEGKNWETLHAGLTAPLNGIEGNFYVGYFTELPDRLLGAFEWVDRSDPTLSFVNPETTGILPMRSLLAESTDRGETWGPYRWVSLAPQTGASHTGPVWRMPDGTLALPYERWKDFYDDSPGIQAAHLRLSTDDGATWPTYTTVAHDPNLRIMYWDQRIARHPETGQLAVMFWTHDRDLGQDIHNHIAWGTPDGQTWTTPTPTPMQGQHCEPIALGGDCLLAVYVHRTDPPTLRAVLSEDYGKTWNIENELVFYDSRVGTEPGITGQPSFEEFWQSMMAWRFGHPRGVLLPNGDVFVAYYAGDAYSQSIYWVRIDPSQS